MYRNSNMSPALSSLASIKTDTLVTIDNLTIIASPLIAKEHQVESKLPPSPKFHKDIL
jgi:hypothetical protein